MKILMICKYPPIQGGVSADCYWTAQLLGEMGHDVQVLTNADEVEQAYRVSMDHDDERRLTGYARPNCVKVVSTSLDPRHVFVPQTNPSVSKLLSVALDLVDASKPDVIWGQYIEPFGVVAFLLAELTGIPYIFRHAGSDIGRLMLTQQLRNLHCSVLRNAALLVTQPQHHQRLEAVGVRPDKFIRLFPIKMRPDLFFPTPVRVGKPLQLGIYGKVGEAKGTEPLLRAMALLRDRGEAVCLRAHWGGRDASRFRALVDELDLADVVAVEGFIPHWRIPPFIRSCDAVLFLENRFSITFHHPSVPLEALACGRPVITTREVADKPAYRELLTHRQNAFVIEEAVGAESVAAAIIEAGKWLASRGEFELPALLPFTDMSMRTRMAGILDAVQARLDSAVSQN